MLPDDLVIWIGVGWSALFERLYWMHGCNVIWMFALYYSEVLDITNNNAVVDEYTSKFISGNASFRLWLCFLNWSHSPVKMRYGLSITSADGTFSNIRWASGEVSLPLDKELAYYYDLNVNNTNPAGKTVICGHFPTYALGRHNNNLPIFDYSNAKYSNAKRSNTEY